MVKPPLTIVLHMTYVNRKLVISVKWHNSKASHIHKLSPTYKQNTLDPRSSPNYTMATNNSTWHSIGNFSLHAICLTHIRQNPRLGIKSSQRIPRMPHNTMSSHILHCVTPCHYIHMTRHQLHKFKRRLWLPKNMRRINFMSYHNMICILAFAWNDSLYYTYDKLFL